MKKFIATLALGTILVGSTTQIQAFNLFNLFSKEETIPQTQITINSTIGDEATSTNLNIGDIISEATLLALGTPISTMNAPSCHFEGNDTIYTYTDYTLYTYKEGNDDKLYLIELTTPSIQTQKGAKVGMSMDEITNMYGEGTMYGLLTSYEIDGVSIDFSFDPETNMVTLIEIL
ncbi:hypothetical protein AN639_04985 [Candidatus Epulonipiscium fishelsonii]|uniref:Uncharacterized protein n=1 Tax=Candidatus Epulonipiscium fishelsonii TaxID=77094 RepID=A0ACC8XFZ0_9FIRM|nr:hypothetical protein AN639_04985 [Epulopiscium sp. SCG-B05WGA-EpuloA1]ONI42309.1 hypothetical protein AN396_01915 [Epulopiscium sp. SCG-B11WGA-EpuloA1]ONI47988.1 hypothetical protein AN644_03145 [Epulopiscium sp. SCG-C06WGA-EpuloA1]